MPPNPLSVVGRPIFLAPAALVLMLAGAFLAASISGSRCLASTPGGAPGVVPAATKDCVETGFESHTKTIDVVYYVLTCIFIGIGFFFTYRALRAQQQTNMFEAFTEVHKALCNDRSYSVRAYLHEKFSDDLAKAIQSLAKTQGAPWNGKLTVDGGKFIDAGMVGKNFDVTDTERTRHLSEFRNALKLITTNVNGVDALGAAELTLLDFDMIAVPFCHKNASARKIAEAYRTVLRDTAPLLLPFVAIMHKLRKTDSWYKWHYLFMLEKLITPQELNKAGVTVPESLRVSSPLPPKRTPSAPGSRPRPNAKSHCLSVIGLLAAVALALGMSWEAKGDQLYCQIRHITPGVNKPVLRVDHTTDSMEGYDTHDGDFLPRPDTMPSIDFYSAVTFDPFKLTLDSRPANSHTTIISTISARNLSSSLSSTLIFAITDDLAENAFASTFIFADLYNSLGILVDTYDVKHLAAAGTTIPIAVNNGLCYTLDIRFETPGDADRNGVVDAADYITLKQNYGVVSGATWNMGDFNGNGSVDWDDLRILQSHFGERSGVTQITPEPSALLILAGLVLPGLIRRKPLRPLPRPLPTPDQISYQLRVSGEIA